MAVLTQQSSDVRFREIDLSQTLIQQSSANAAIVFVSKQGRAGLFHMTDAQTFLTEYGTPDPQVSFGHYCALDFFREGNSLTALRVVGTGALYAAAILNDDGSGNTQTSTIVGGVTDPVAPNPGFSTLAAAPKIPLVLFYPKHGQGSYANTLAIQIRSNNLPAPTGLAGTVQSAGGTLSAATYQYVVSAISSTGESLGSAQQAVVVSVGTTNQITLTWNAVAGAIGYKVYGRSSPTHYIATVGGATLTYVDTGAVTPNAALSPITLVANLTLTKTFFVDVYDTSTSTSTPVETFEVSLTNSVGDDGVQQEITQRINPFSQYINCTSNVPSLVTVPTITGWQAAYTLLGGGSSGTAPTNGNIQTAWDSFNNTETSDVDALINAGYTDVGIQQEMEAVARKRGTAVALLDVPSTSQGSAQSMIDYRNLTLNLNSSYASLFGPDVLESDPYNGTALYVPFSGWAAALCARTDRVAQPWFSIAGLNRGLVNVLGVRQKFSDADRTLLFKAQVNYTRNFTGQGIALWEQTTMQAKASALSWLNVRRLVNIIKKSTYQFLIYALEEPNDDFLRRQIVSSISEYLTIIQNARGLQSFLVVSNDTNNPPDLYNAGILKVTVFITPTIAVHEIQLDLVITKEGVTYSEINISNLG